MALKYPQVEDLCRIIYSNGSRIGFAIGLISSLCLVKNTKYVKYVILHN